MLQDIQNQQNDHIMALFNNLPLDKEEQDFLNSVRGSRAQMDDFDKDDPFNHTMMTNFDGELDEMEKNQFKNHRQREILQSFWSNMKDDIFFQSQENNKQV